MIDPVCPLEKALYGHPDAGGYWEAHCESHLLSVGFTTINGWKSCYWHERLKMFLIVYVDDFKMSGPEGHFDEAWKLIRRDSKGVGIDTDDPQPTGKFLGCTHKVFEAPANAFNDCLPAAVTGIRVMPDGEVKPQFQTKAQVLKAQLEGAELTTPGHSTKVRYIEYDMEDFFESCCKRYLELAPKGTTLRHVTTPFIDESVSCITDFGIPESEARTKALAQLEANQSELSNIASKCLMKVLYGARMCRYDLLRPVCHLASQVTKWDRTCDRKLHKLMCYISSTLDVRMVGKVGDSKESLRAAIFSDADFAGCAQTMRSTSGVFAKIMGPNTHMPISGASTKQTAVSHSTAEAELVAAEVALRKEGLPVLDLLQVVLGNPNTPVICEFFEDNQATIRMLESGKNPTLRHLPRTHKVDLAWLFQEFKKSTYDLKYCTSEEQAADIFTKHFVNSDKWNDVMHTIGHVRMKDMWTKYKFSTPPKAKPMKVPDEGVPKVSGRPVASPRLPTLTTPDQHVQIALSSKL
jgi:hypothetical protein